MNKVDITAKNILRIERSFTGKMMAKSAGIKWGNASGNASGGVT